MSLKISKLIERTQYCSLKLIFVQTKSKFGVWILDWCSKRLSRLNKAHYCMQNLGQIDSVLEISNDNSSLDKIQIKKKYKIKKPVTFYKWITSQSTCPVYIIKLIFFLFYLPDLNLHFGHDQLNPDFHQNLHCRNLKNLLYPF